MSCLCHDKSHRGSAKVAQFPRARWHCRLEQSETVVSHGCHGISGDSHRIRSSSEEEDKISFQIVTRFKIQVQCNLTNLECTMYQIHHMFTFFCVTFWTFCSFFTPEEHCTLSEKKIWMKKNQFGANRDLDGILTYAYAEFPFELQWG